MPDWRLNLVDASLDGTTFLYRSMASEAGRGQELHEVPFAKTPHFLEDLGPLAEVFPCDAFFIGDNYLAEAQDFIDIVLTGRQMLFIHPYRGGPFTVNLFGKVKRVEKDEQGRFVQVTFTLVETGLSFPLVPIHIPTKISLVVIDFDAALAATTLLSIVGAVGSVISGIVGGMGEAADALRVANAIAASKIGVVSSLTDSVNDFKSGVTTLLNTPTAAVGALVALVAEAIDIRPLIPAVVQDTDVVVTEVDQTGILLGMFVELDTFESVPATPPTNTTQSLIEQNAHKAVTDTFKAALAIHVTEQLVQLEANSVEQAEALAQNILPSLEDILLSGFNDEVSKLVLQIRALALKHFTQTDDNLPRVGTIVLDDPVPSLVLAYRLFGDSRRAADFIARNRVKNPMLLPPGIDLEFLADV